MKKYLFVICAGAAAAVMLLSGCGKSDEATEAVTETTEQTTENTEDESSLKPQIDEDYKNKLAGTWENNEKTISFEKDNTFVIINKEGSEESGNFSVVASNDGKMAISFAVENKEIEVYIAKFAGDNKLVLENTLNEKTELVRSEAKETQSE